MNPKRTLIFLMFAIAAPISALAQEQQQAYETPPQTNTFINLLMTLLPLVLVCGFLWFILRKFTAKQQKRSSDYIAQQIRHMERVEQMLERIAKAIEKKDSGPV